MSIRRWLPHLAIVALYAAVFVVLRIWLQPVFTERREPARLAMLRRWDTINQRVMLGNLRLRELALRDSLLDVLPRAPGVYIDLPADSVAVSVQRPGVEETRLVGLRELVIREAGGRPKVSLNIVGVPFGYGAHPEVRQGGWREVYVSGFADGRPFCVVALPIRPGTAGKPVWLPPHSGLLGPCAFWARHGAPGPGIEKWLRSGGTHFAASQEGFGSRKLQRSNVAAAQLGSNVSLELPIAGQACLAGDTATCASAIREPFDADDWSSTRLVPGERGMLLGLEREFGAERFQRFWTSADPFEQAFLRAFGVELGAWVHQKMLALGRFDRGSRLDATSVVLTLLLLGLCAGAVFATTERRTI